MRRLNNIFYRFLWSREPDKINSSILTQDYSNGGLRMVGVKNGRLGELYLLHENNLD